MPEDKNANNEQVLDDEIEIVEDSDNDEGFGFGGDPDEDADNSFLNDSDEDDFNEEDDDSDDVDDAETDSDNDETDDDSDDSNAQDDKDKRIAELERELAETKAKSAEKYSKLENQSKDTLKKLGIEVDGDVGEALEKAAAETEGKTLEEYRKEKADNEAVEKAKNLLAQQKFEKIAAEDLSTLKKSYPDLLNVAKIRDCFDSFDDFATFGRLRDAGIDVKTAYLAVNGDKVSAKQTAAAQQKAANSGKQHLNSVAPVNAPEDSKVVMSKKTLEEWRDMFPDKTDKELKELYKQTL